MVIRKFGSKNKKILDTDFLPKPRAKAPLMALPIDAGVRKQLINILKD